jgi:hypothetical protein
MFSAGQGIADGFTYRAHEAKDLKPRSARVEINIKRIGSNTACVWSHTWC